MNCKECPALLKVQGSTTAYLCAARNEHLPYLGACRIKHDTLILIRRNIENTIATLNDTEKKKFGEYAMKFERVNK